MLHQGRIKYWNNAKGYGFIAREGEDDIFVHISQVPRNLQPTLGMQVSFGLKQDNKGRWQAQNVELLDPSFAPDSGDNPPAPLTGLQKVWQIIKAIAAIILIVGIAWKSVTAFYSFNNLPAATSAPATSTLEPSNSHNE